MGVRTQFSKNLNNTGSFIIAGLLIALFFIPPLIFVPISYNGVWIATNYREIKLAAVSICAWALIASFIRFRLGKYPTSIIKMVLKDPILWGLGALTLLSLISASYAYVWEAALYEGYQWFTLSALYIVLALLFLEEKWRRLALITITIAFALVSIIGFIQLKTDIPFLLGMHYKITSTFGAKNPCFVSLSSQIFIVLFLTLYFFFKRKIALSFFFAIIFFAELLYVALSQSRTSLAGLVGGGIILVLCLLFFLKNNKLKGILLAVCIIAAIALPIVAKSIFPQSWHRTVRTIESKVKPLLKNPNLYFRRARGQALLDTLDMVKENPFGVGAGNWGFAYCLYHKRVNKRAFRKTNQMLRAHNDYVQMLGELGIPGFLILVSLFLVQVYRMGKILRKKEMEDKEKLLFILISVQISIVAIMLLFTYYLEYPYRKFLFVFLMALTSSLYFANKFSNQRILTETVSAPSKDSI